MRKRIDAQKSAAEASEQIINNATIVLRGAELVAEHSGKGTFEHMLPMMSVTKLIEGQKK